MAYGGIEAQRLALTETHIECNTCGYGCKTNWGTILVLVPVMVVFLLALWLLHKA